MMNMAVRVCIRFTLLLVVALVSSVVHAQAYPARPVRFIIPFGTGGSADIIGRLTAQKLTESLGQQFIADNRAGAGGIIGTELAAKAAADGYTLVLGSFGTHTGNPNLYRKLPYDPLKDFAPVSMVATVPLVLAVHPSVPAKSIQDLIALARAKPRSLNYASSGNGTGTHLAAELFKSLADVEMTHIPYRSAGTAVSELTAGQVEVMFSTLPSVLPLVKAGKLRALGISSAARSEAAPGLPPIGQSVKGFDAGTWFGVLAPAGAPASIVSLLGKEIVRITAMADVRSRLIALGAEPIGNTPEQFNQYIKAELPRWGKVIRAAGITLD
jgi:tripartite-type tricarboxylate transporter receptor subunit TctC